LEDHPKEGSQRPDAGLCSACVHARWIRGARSAFLRCALSDRDAAYSKYPPLPVLSCRGFRDSAEPPRDAEA